MRTFRNFTFPIAFLLLLSSISHGTRPNADKNTPHLERAEASHFAQLALGCVTREFPNKPSHVMRAAAEVRSPAELHPAFYDCFDWHSSVHGHWMLVRLLRLFAALPPGHGAREVLENAARRHAGSALAHVTSGDYAGEHWLASFAVYLLTEKSRNSSS